MKKILPSVPGSPRASARLCWAVSTCALLACLLGYTIYAQGNLPPARLNLTTSEVPDDYTLDWHGEQGHIYFVQKSNDLTNWKFVPFHAVGADAPLSQTMHSTAPRAFYRLVHSDDPNSELLQKIHNDAGLSTWEQIQLGFDPFAWTESGNPGIHDAWAKKHFGTIHIDPDGDPDGDGLSNRLEFLYGTDPHSPDAGITGPSAPRRVAAYATNTTAFITWQLSRGLQPVDQNRIYRDGVLISTPKIPSDLNSQLLGWTDIGLEPGRTYTYEVQARDTAAKYSARVPVQVTTAAAPALPEPWQAADVGTPQHPGRSTFDSESGTFVLSGRNGEILSDFHFVHREFSGDFRVSARVNILEPAAGWAKAGIAIAEDLTGEGRGLSYSITGKYDAQILSVPVAGGGFNAMTTPGVQNTGWLGIERQGDLWTYSASEDGQNWFVVGEEEHPLPETVFVGLGLAGVSKFTTTAVFSDLQVQDLNDVPEAGSGGPDSDGDGISDWEETHIYHTDPDLHDIWLSGTVADLGGSQGTASFGSWRTDGATLISQTVKASVEYQIEITEAGVYRIEAELAAGHNDTNRRFFPVDIHLDGQLLERFNVHLPDADSALIHAATPWLEPGIHTIRLHFDNTLSHRSLAVLGLRVQSLGGLDPDADGIPAWMHNRLAATNSVEMAPTSLVSPANFEGVARYADFFRLLADGVDTPVHPAPAFGWYADIPLDPDAPVQISASFESGGRMESFGLSWESFNLLDHGSDYDEEPLRIRTGDSLLLTAHTAATGAATISVTRAGADPVEYSLADPAAEPVPHLFEEAGIYTVTGAFEDGDGVQSEETVIVEVVHARFSGDAVAKAFPLLPWENPLLPRNVHLVADSAVTLMDGGELPGGGSLLQVASSASHSSAVVARLEEEGLIAHHATVHGISVASNNNTAIDSLKVYDDGSRLIGTPIILNRITPDTRIEVEIFVKAATFEDGTTFKTFTAADFDQFGRIYVKFLLPAGVKSTYCHRIYVYEGDTYLGSF